MKKLISINLIILVFSCFILTAKAENPCNLNIIVTIPQAAIPTPADGGGGAAGIAIPVGVAGAGAAGAGAAFAPLLLAGLSPGSVVAAAAPINCIQNKCCYLQTALKNHFNTTNLNQAISKTQTSPVKSFYAVNDKNILNGTFNIEDIKLPPNLLNAPKIGFKGTIVSSAFNEVNDRPELELRLFKNISTVKLQKRYESKAFMKDYLMKKWEIPYSSRMKAYSKGIHEINGVIDTAKIKDKNSTLKSVVSYMEEGFKKNQATNDPKVKTYAYLIEFTAQR